MVAERYPTREEQERHRRTFRCVHCVRVAGIDGYEWRRNLGVWCRRCRRWTYVLAEQGPSPYVSWPFPEQRPLTDQERLNLLESDRDADGMLFLGREDLALYERLWSELRPGKRR